MSEEFTIKSFNTWVRPVIFLAVIVLHGLVFVIFNFKSEEKFDESDYKEVKVFKLVDIEEFVPPPPIVEEKQVEVVEQPKASETVEETEKEVIEKKEQPDPFEEFLPQHKISKTPVFPAKRILSRLEYPAMAKKQGIEGVVLLELFIDKTGKVQRIKVLKDPGYGFAESAVSAFSGVTCVPALVNGEPCAVRYRYPVRFKLS